MTETIDLLCFRCKHFRKFVGGCDAFPIDIPDSILITNKHSKPLPEQENNIVFEAIDSDKEFIIE